MIQNFEQPRGKKAAAGWFQRLVDIRKRQGETHRPAVLFTDQHKLGIEDLFHLLTHEEPLLAGHGDEAPIPLPGRIVNVP